MDMEFDPSEISHSVFEAYLTFALFDNARRAQLGRGLDEHRAALGRVMAPMTEVAAATPKHAWFPVARTAEEIATATADNRMVAYPYTKLMTSIMDVDMAAASCWRPPRRQMRWACPRTSGCTCAAGATPRTRPTWPATPSCGAPPPWRRRRRAALRGAGIGADDVAHFDLYSCFASSVCFALDALGVARTMPARAAVTQTGGLPYHGGPGSNYMTHSLAAMAETLRADPGSCGIVSGVGMHMQKHAYGVWSTKPPGGGRAAGGAGGGGGGGGGGVVGGADGVVSDPARYVATAEPVLIVGSPEGTAVVATYTVLHGRDSEPERALLVCDLPEGGRSYALLDGGVEALAMAETDELIGRSVTLRQQDAVNLASLA